MIIRFKMFWKLFLIPCGIGLIFLLVERFQEFGFFHFGNFIFFIGVIMFNFFFIFLFPTLKITLGNNGIDIYWKISLGFVELFEMDSYYIPYNMIFDVSSVLPAWFPFHIITVAGNGKFFFFGMYLTQKKETFVLLANKIKPDVMDKEARKILMKYKNKYDYKLKDK